ncbi:hypothetical protein AVEN_175198-1 [Araneus ventricosus]|uniref:Helitron helicase-like domain-containing protein n=1 Tax=Araneus ventricosus TaxID=182803 RepID=A0A4Y2HH72_ARAVE|nr:hypothetical protein AVEN_175198-1 [Araneus ventricosus]
MVPQPMDGTMMNIQFSGNSRLSCNIPTPLQCISSCKWFLLLMFSSSAISDSAELSLLANRSIGPSSSFSRRCGVTEGLRFMLILVAYLYSAMQPLAHIVAKRGLLHAHILICLKDSLHVQRVDDSISADIPNPQQNPVGARTMRKHRSTFSMHERWNLHKAIPTPILKETKTGRNGYPLYRHRVLQFYEVYQIRLYVCEERNDMSVLELTSGENDLNDIHQYQMGRYISSNEAVPDSRTTPTVIHLSLHFEN